VAPVNNAPEGSFSKTESGQVTLEGQHSTARVSKRPPNESAAQPLSRGSGTDLAWLDLELLTKNEEFTI
jgi:hypothetical protein